MNDLVIREDFQRAFPGMADGIRKAAEIFNDINSFEDIERYFLLGAGLSPNTYRCYLSAVKDFYNLTDGLNPLQVIPADIERYYDTVLKRVDRNTAYIKIMGLKKFFKGISKVIPFHVSPFDQMTPELIKKLSKTKKDNTTKQALSKAELQRVFAFLDTDTSLKGLQNKAVIRILFSTGLRSFELCQAKWRDIELDEDTGVSFLRGIGKGEKVFRQEIADPQALDALTAAYKKQFKKDPSPNDYLVYSLESYKGKKPAGMKNNTLWVRFNNMGKELKAQGLIRESIQFSPHLLRRSYLTLLLKSGMDLKSVQQISRHASIEVLAKHYIDTNVPAGGFFKKILGAVA